MDLGQIKMLGKGELARGPATMAPAQGSTKAGRTWRKVGALALGVAAVGLPINHIGTYALLVVLAVIVFTGKVSARPRAWLAAGALVAVAAGAQVLLAPPRIDEGHNVFLPGGPGALQRGLPADVYRHMLDAFDAFYPPAVRCQHGSFACWQDQGFPDTTYAFSADGIWHKTGASRSVAALDFSDPVWLRLGFVNENRYNWGTSAPDVHRNDRDRRSWMGLFRWHLAMPWFEMLRLPAAYAGGELCWRGDVMWEGEGGVFAALPASGCRAIAPADAGRRVFGIAIKPETLAMHLTPPLSVRLQQFAVSGLALAGAFAVVIMLVSFRARRTIVPFLLIGLSVIVIAVDDASFLGGVRPFDGGDDGLFYDGVGRIILQKLLAGDFYGALQGGENVFYYGGPGLRYFRALEHIIFGETYLGYLSLVLCLPFLVWLLFRRFLPQDWSLTLALVFVAIPVGAIFGTSFTDYAKWASHGFADPMAYILFFAAILPLIGTSAAGPGCRFAPAFFGALLLALAIFAKPIVAPAAAVLLGGCGLVCLYSRQFGRLAGLCLGFSAVLSMALHNWVYGHVFVPLSANSDNPIVLVMPPSAWAAAFKELLHLDFAGGHWLRGLRQIPDWLTGPAESYATVPLNAAAVAILLYVVLRGRSFDAWLRLLGAAALAQHAVALFYVGTVARYHFLTWFLTMLVDVVWFHQIGIGWLNRRYPALSDRFAAQSWRMRLASGLARLTRLTRP
jgi:hypothetical protein